MTPLVDKLVLLSLVTQPASRAAAMARLMAVM
jgi:hypothetical protein